MNVTPIQISIGQHLAEGLTDKEIAEKLNKTHLTVKNQKYAAFKETGSATGPQYVYKLLKAGLIS